MSVVLGSGSFAFEVVPEWAKLPTGWSFRECAAVAVDHEDRVYVFARGEHPVLVFTPDGDLVGSWGEDVFTGAHGATFAPDGTLWLVDEGDHTARQFTLEGRLLMTLGRRGEPSAFQSGEPFNRPTHVAVDPGTGDLFIADGYGNSRVHHWSASGDLIGGWGRSGTRPGEFHLPHNIAIDRHGRVYVADRENHRVQIFDRDGSVRGQWVGMHRASALWIEEDGARDHVYVAELGSVMPFSREASGLGPRISVYDAADGALLARIGEGPAAEEPGRFITPHGLAMDSRGDLYVAECSWSTTGRYLDPPRELRSLQKLVRV